MLVITFRCVALALLTITAACVQGLKPTARRLSTNATQSVNTPSSKPVAYWLFAMSGLVAGMVTIGGITRLTRSGLSMTDWKLQGNWPPMNPSEWEAEFERYKKFPEWQQRKSMTVDEFKFIYYWEYGHRMMGRALGFAFAIPGAYFAARGMIPKRLYPRVALLFGLGGAQGLIGWWMVKSGLDMDPAQRKEIRVSPYRLTTHLSMAFTTYCLLLWTGMDVLHGPEAMRATAQKMSAEVLKHARKVRSLAAVSAVLAATTVVSGAFVAGNDAGRAYNTFPLMNDKLIPVEDMFTMEPTWRNFFENTATVQVLTLHLNTCHVGNVSTSLTHALFAN
jgi:cytochrome c oxidase assembly protein subunit 15